MFIFVLRYAGEHIPFKKKLSTFIHCPRFCCSLSLPFLFKKVFFVTEHKKLSNEAKDCNHVCRVQCTRTLLCEEKGHGYDKWNLVWHIDATQKKPKSNSYESFAVNALYEQILSELMCEFFVVYNVHWFLDDFANDGSDFSNLPNTVYFTEFVFISWFIEISSLFYGVPCQIATMRNRKEGEIWKKNRIKFQPSAVSDVILVVFILLLWSRPIIRFSEIYTQ